MAAWVFMQQCVTRGTGAKGCRPLMYTIDHVFDVFHEYNILRSFIQIRQCWVGYIPTNQKWNE